MSTAKPTITYNWDVKAQRYEHFTDMGNYCVVLDEVDFANFEQDNKLVSAQYDLYKPACTATVKTNKQGQVIVGRNMDVEISQQPAYIVPFRGGKYATVGFTYQGNSGKYTYDQLALMDQDDDTRRTLPYLGTDAMNETGLYVEMNMRDLDSGYDLSVTGTNPGKPRACTLSAAVLVALNCATVEEAVEFLNNSYDWYTLRFAHGGDASDVMEWNMSLLIGDAQGNYGLAEFGRNGVYFTPYINGQGNYYIHPELAEYVTYGSGYGRLSTALKGLLACQTERDMMDNMKACMWKNELLNPGCMGYSDFEADMIKRRETPVQELQAGFEAQLAPYQPLAKAFYAGDEKALRDSGAVWTTAFNFGVNCATKHLVLRLWENDAVEIDVQW